MEWFVLVLVIVVVAALAALIVMRQRSVSMSRRYGPEYYRAVDEQGGRRAGEAELRRLEHRRDELDLRELDPAVRGRFVERWRTVQLGFVDDPAESVVMADDLVVEVMAARGYPVDDPDERTGMVVADHPELAEDYRSAHAIRQRSDQDGASVDELREGFQHYRDLFGRLLDDSSGDRRPAAVPEGPQHEEDSDVR